MEKEKLYCYDCKYCLVEEYNEWIDVYCLKHKPVKKVALFDTCEDVKEREE